jgi:RES domain-containing protein
MRAYRICIKEFGPNAAQAFSGLGGHYAPGRWNSVGRQIVYVGSSLSLASLEVFVHLKNASKLKPWVYYTLEIPDTVITQVSNLPPHWSRDVITSQAIGDTWLAGKSSAVLAVPSAIIPIETNYLINPLHSDFNLSWVKSDPLPFVFDQRMLDRVV